MTVPVSPPRPRGRLKTKHYETLTARFPQDFATLVKRYATENHQPLSAVIRAGVFLLIEQTASHVLSDTKSLTPEIVSDRKAPPPDIVSDTKSLTEIDILSDTHEKIVSDINFDTSKYVLGKLCPRSHDYEHTGQSLLRRSNRHCLMCDREKFHERKQTKRTTMTKRTH